MTDNMNTADLVKRLRECSSDEAMWSRQAADRIEQLEAALTRANASNNLWSKNSRETFEAMASMRDAINEFAPMPSLESDLLQGPESSVFFAVVAEAVVSALTRANAATAAAYEVAALAINDRGAIEQENFGLNRATQNFFRARNMVRGLATPDQTAALDKLIAEAVEPLLIAAKSGLRFIENTESELGIILGCGDSLRNAILAASKKGGV